MTALAVCLLLGGAGCTYNFDDFNARDGLPQQNGPDSAPDTGLDGGADGGDADAAADTADTASSDVPDTTSDTDATGDADETGPADGGDTGDTGMDADGGDGVVQVGARCTKDADCAGMGSCMSGYCTRSCQSDGDCPGDAVCQTVAGSSKCLVPCGPEEGCPEVDGRTDLGCTLTSSTPRIGQQPTRRHACLPDADDDGIRDATDNCPMRANIRQTDADGDGEGGVCDMAPTCHAKANLGVVDYGSTSFPYEQFGHPSSANRPWLPVAGGVDGTDKPTDATLRLDRTDATWMVGAKLPSATAFLHPAPVPGTDAWMALPGAARADSPQIGRLLLFDAQGAPSFDGGFGLGVVRPRLATTRLGTVVVLGYVDTGMNGLERRLWRYDPDNDTWKTVQSTSAMSKRTWEVVPNRQGGLHFYSRPAQGASTPYTGDVLTVGPEAHQVDAHSFSYPTLSSAPNRPYDPMLVPGPGNRRLYAFDRASGEAAYLDLESDSTTRAANIDLNLPFNVLALAANPQAPSFVLFGRKSASPDKLFAKEYFIECAKSFDSLDTDGDTVPDMVDNCPTISNAPHTGPQADADDDGIGNPCDDDADNDGVSNSDDFDTPGGGPRRLSLDSDDDGEGNATDNDDDGDGIKDAEDRYPLDTNNDGLPNFFDDDDDNDGYGDEAERKAGSSRTDPLSFPNAGIVSFVREDPSSGNRLVRVGSFTNLSRATTEIDDTQTPYRPRLFDAGRGVLALDAPAGMATGIQWRSATTGQSPRRRNLNVALRGVDPVATAQDGSLEDVVLIKEAGPAGMSWELVRRTIGESSFQKLVDGFPQITALDAEGGDVGFVGGVGGCPRCLSVYRAPAVGGVPSLVAAPNDEPVSVRKKGSATVVLTHGATGQPDTLYYLGPGGAMRRVSHPNFAAINSAVPMNFDGHLVVSAKMPGDSFELWFYNGVKERWHRLFESSSHDLVEVDWIR